MTDWDLELVQLSSELGVGIGELCVGIAEGLLSFAGVSLDLVLDLQHAVDLLSQDYCSFLTLGKFTCQSFVVAVPHLEFGDQTLVFSSRQVAVVFLRFAVARFESGLGFFTENFDFLLELQCDVLEYFALRN